ncbi:MAG: hypothetical protein ACPGU7_04625 [Gammaproteobacteria bacterium]
MSATAATRVLSWAECDQEALRAVLARYGLEVHDSDADTDIPGSFWGDEEAGLIGNVLYARADTPVHSILHEGCHYICMDGERRDGLHTDAGGGYDEENGVCYLQILLAGHLPDMGRARMFADMDAWGYSFRLGSARAWFEQDAEDARQWLIDAGILSNRNELSWRIRP